MHGHTFNLTIYVKGKINKIEKRLGSSGRVVVRPSGTEPVLRILVEGQEKAVANISSQLNKLIDVVEASDISERNIVWRELALIKVSCNQSKRVELLELSKIFRVNVIDVGLNNITFEISGSDSKIDSFVELLEEFGVEEIMRTGRIAILRGATKVGMKDGEFNSKYASDVYLSKEGETGSV